MTAPIILTCQWIVAKQKLSVICVHIGSVMSFF